MYCPHCGKPAADDANYCPGCGKPLVRVAVVPDDAAAPVPTKTPTPNLVPTSTAVADNRELTGVKGWLLWLCIVMTILTPIDILISIGKNNMSETEILLQLAIGGYAIVTGINLWRIAKTALLQAKIYMFVVAGLLLLGLAASEHIDYEIVGALISQGIWTAYLFRSKRVRNTYPKR